MYNLFSLQSPTTVSHYLQPSPLSEHCHTTTTPPSGAHHRLLMKSKQNQESKLPLNLTKGLIRELNNNVKRVVYLYGDLSNSFTKSMDASSEG
ncbi:putative protein EARLY FLOWERING 4 [Helianthus debilis subsp. tardiflorus]